MKTLVIRALFLLSLPITFTHCGGTGTGTGNPARGNVSLQSNPLAGPSAGSLLPGFSASPLFALFSAALKIQDAWASVSPFQSFKACNDTVKFIDNLGNTLSIGGNSEVEVGPGLLTFSPTSTSPMAIGSLNIDPGSNIKEIDITFAAVPSLCQGEAYAVQFDDGINGPINITQNTAFKFIFSGSGVDVSADPQTFTLLLGQIVDGMVALGAGLNNSTIQTVNVGQAQ